MRWILFLLLTPHLGHAEDWWSLKPLTAPTVPVILASATNPIDAFVLAKLKEKGLTPSPRADRATLIRRLTYDLHGLPPTPEEIDAFVNDTSIDADAKLIDRLLASPHYGERWGRHWLDVVPYADTHGYDKDKRRDHAWPYRDYVIASFNEDKPYSRFIREQLAGDVLFPGDPTAAIATGFIAAGPWDFVGHVELREGTVEKEKTRLIDRDDMVANTFSTFQSLTVHCARCHDHKFDPIPQADYYRLQAVFAGVERGDRPVQGRLVFAAVPQAKPRAIHLLKRGDVTQKKAEATPGGLSCVASLPSDFDLHGSNREGDRRAALANWIANPDNPLTWRSMANRVWHYHFGRGIVDTPNDFGANGSRPTHPELLDFLALQLREHQSIKKLHRLILTSQTYQQVSMNREENSKIDGENRYLWRANRGRLDAESLRDSILSTSGKLDGRMGGPGYDLFAFKDDHSPVYDHTDSSKSDRPEAWRRTVYRFTVRSVPNPFLDCLDGADPNANTPRRNQTLTALQALALLNDAFVIRQANYFAERLNRIDSDPSAKIDALFRLALGRKATDEERKLFGDYAEKHGLANACRLVWNLNEFVFVD